MDTYIQPGTVLDLVAPYAVNSGDGAKVGNIFGVAIDTYTSGANGSFQTEGVVNLAKTSGEAYTQGLRVFWNDSTKKVTSTSTSNIAIGYAIAVYTTADLTCNVKLCGTTPAGT